jgi:uncharacterized cupin superfamily protein
MWDRETLASYRVDPGHNFGNKHISSDSDEMFVVEEDDGWYDSGACRHSG